MINDLKQANKKLKTSAPVVKLDAKPAPVTPNDLSNQELSSDQAERVRQLDFQAFESEREQTNS